MPPIIKNEPFTSYVFFKENINLDQLDTQVKLICYDSILNHNLEYSIIVNKTKCLENNICFKLGTHSVIQYLQE